MKSGVGEAGCRQVMGGVREVLRRCLTISSMAASSTPTPRSTVVAPRGFKKSSFEDSGAT